MPVLGVAALAAVSACQFPASKGPGDPPPPPPPTSTIQVQAAGLAVSSHDFGKAIKAVRSPDVSFSIVNEGNGSVQIGSSAVQVTGANASDFVVTQPPGAMLANGQSVDFQVAFQPSTSSTESATVKVTPAGGAASVSFPVSGSGTDFGIQLADHSLATSQAFGVLEQGASSSPVTFTVYNAGSGSLDLTAQGTGTESSDFVVSALSPSATVAAKSSATFTVTFAPTTYGSRTAQVVVAGPGATPSASFSVSGTGSSGTISLTDPNSTTLTSGQTFDLAAPSGVDHGSAGSMQLTVTNTGTHALYFLDSTPRLASGGSAAFAVTLGGLFPSSLAAGAHTTFTITWGAQVNTTLADDTYNDTLIVETSDEVTGTVSIPVTYIYHNGLY
ncbi:MAG TPA: choice-of-anchor D domain-containing protein [Spirochaetia bacterium]|nr:choice-of-anchor D domain-containing protein [Spirochaetia bacterium]